MKMITVPAESLRLIVRVLDGYATPNQEKNLPHALDNMRIAFSEDELAGGEFVEGIDRPAVFSWREQPEWFR